MERDPSLDTLLDLDGVILVIEPETRHWVRFVVIRVPPSENRPHGLSYSLTLHGSGGERLAGFDNAHAVGRGKGERAFDHSHRLKTVRPYEYKDAGGVALRFLGVSRRSAPRERNYPVKTLKIGIASYEAMKARTMAIARGELKHKPGDPKVWFPSTESFAKVLSQKNRILLSTIAETHPVSLQELADRTGRKTSNLSRTLKTMEHYGFVRLHRGERGRIRPEVPYRSISLELPFNG